MTGRWPDPNSKKAQKSEKRKPDKDFLTEKNANTNNLYVSGDVPLSICLVYDDSAAADNFLVPATNIITSSLMLPGPVPPTAKLHEVMKSAALVDSIGPGNCGGADGDPASQHSSTATTSNQSAISLQPTVPTHVSNYPVQPTGHRSEVLDGVLPPSLPGGVRGMVEGLVGGVLH